MLDKETSHLLKQLFDTVSEIEMIIEHHRQTICADKRF